MRLIIAKKCFLLSSCRLEKTPLGGHAHASMRTQARARLQTRTHTRPMEVAEHPRAPQDRRGVARLLRRGGLRLQGGEARGLCQGYAGASPKHWAAEARPRVDSSLQLGGPKASGRMLTPYQPTPVCQQRCVPGFTGVLELLENTSCQYTGVDEHGVNISAKAALVAAFDCAHQHSAAWLPD